jgi:hypothetical protein
MSLVNRFAHLQVGPSVTLAGSSALAKEPSSQLEKKSSYFRESAYVTDLEFQTFATGIGVVPFVS